MGPETGRYINPSTLLMYEGLEKLVDLTEKLVKRVDPQSEELVADLRVVQALVAGVLTPYTMISVEPDYKCLACGSQFYIPGVYSEQDGNTDACRYCGSTMIVRQRFR